MNAKIFIDVSIDVPPKFRQDRFFEDIEHKTVGSPLDSKVESKEYLFLNGVVGPAVSAKRFLYKRACVLSNRSSVKPTLAGSTPTAVKKAYIDAHFSHR